MSQIGEQLSGVDAEQLHAAVNTVLAAHQESLTAGASESPASADDKLTDAAVYFHTLLELAYLVASADGFAAEERAALAQLIETATSAALDRTVLLAHFDDLDSGTEVLGRRERLARAAANIETKERHEGAVRFAALIAAADGHMDTTEVDVLVELGSHFGFERPEVEAIATDVVAEVASHLGGAQ